MYNELSSNQTTICPLTEIKKKTLNKLHVHKVI